jgi:hypothetical protein
MEGKVRRGILSTAMACILPLLAKLSVKSPVIRNIKLKVLEHTSSTGEVPAKEERGSTGH